MVPAPPPAKARSASRLEGFEVRTELQREQAPGIAQVAFFIIKGIH